MTLIIDLENKKIKGYCLAKEFRQGKVKQEIIELINEYNEDKE